MTLGQLLGALRERNIRLVADGERLRCIAPPGALTPELSAQIKEAKPELLALLAEVAHRDDGAFVIPRVEAQARFPLSFAQRRAVLAGRISGAVSAAFLLRGPLAVPALVGTLAHIVQRHVPLRTRFHLEGDDCEQEALPEVGVDLGEHDLAELAEPERRTALDQLLARLSGVEFDVREPPLFRFALVRLGPREHVLHAAVSGLVFDGGSLDVFWRELCAGYAALSRGQPWPLSPLPVGFADVVAWQHRRVGAELAGQQGFWRKALGQELPPLPLPTDRPRSRQASARGASVPFELPTETATALHRFSGQSTLTPQIAMLAALYALLARLSATRDLVIATPVDARTQPSLEGLIGAFGNLLLLRTTVDLERSFGDFVIQVRDLCLAAYDHQEFPLERLDVRSPRAGAAGFSPAFQVEFSYQQVSHRVTAMGELSLSPWPLASAAAASDIALWVEDWGDRVSGIVELKLDLLDPETVRHWLACYQHLLRALLENPGRPMRDLDLLGSERERIAARMAQVTASPPAWAVARAGDAVAAGGGVAWQVVDDRDQPTPFGIPGHLAVGRDGSWRRIGKARLRHDGVLVEVQPDPPAPAKPPTPAPAANNHTELELRLCLLFEELLGVSPVTPDQDYFDLGGNSLLAVRLFGAIHEQFGVRLPMATLVDAGSPAKLARAINAKVPNRDGCVIRLKAGGDGPALFLVHDGDGETLLYRNLALLMPKEVAVFGIEPRREGRLTMVHATIEAAATHYLREIRKRQASGPYFLGGLCAGGLIAFEVARQLEGQGEEVRHLALIESAPPQAKLRTGEMRQRWQSFEGNFRDFSLATAGHKLRTGARKLSSFLRYDLEARYQGARSRVLGALLRRGFGVARQWPDWLGVPTTREVYADAERKYRPGRLLHSQAVIYRATRGEGVDLPFAQILVDPLFGWQELLGRKAVAVDVPGGHGTLLRHPHVAAIATHLRASLAAETQAPTGGGP